MNTSSWKNNKITFYEHLAKSIKKKIIFDIVKILHFIHGILKTVKSFINETFLYLSYFRSCTFDMIIFKMISDDEAAYKYKILKKNQSKVSRTKIVYTRICYLRDISYSLHFCIYEICHIFIIATFTSKIRVYNSQKLFKTIKATTGNWLYISIALSCIRFKYIFKEPLIFHANKLPEPMHQSFFNIYLANHYSKNPLCELHV